MPLRVSLEFCGDQDVQLTRDGAARQIPPVSMMLDLELSAREMGLQILLQMCVLTPWRLCLGDRLFLRCQMTMVVIFVLEERLTIPRVLIAFLVEPLQIPLRTRRRIRRQG